MCRRKIEPPEMVIRTAITLRVGEDDDLLEAFRRVPPRKFSAFIKAGLRSGSLEVKIEGLPEDDDLAESLGNFLS